MWQRALSSSGGGGGGADDDVYGVYFNSNGVNTFVNGSTSVSVGNSYATFYVKKYTSADTASNAAFYIYLYNADKTQQEYRELSTLKNFSIPSWADWMQISRINNPTVNLSITFS
jgi:hypothetical protein